MTDFHESWWKDGSLAKTQILKCWRGSRIFFLPLSLTLWDEISRGIMHDKSKTGIIMQINLCFASRNNSLWREFWQCTIRATHVPLSVLWVWIVRAHQIYTCRSSRLPPLERSPPLCFLILSVMDGLCPCQWVMRLCRRKLSSRPSEYDACTSEGLILLGTRWVQDVPGSHHRLCDTGQSLIHHVVSTK